MRKFYLITVLFLGAFAALLLLPLPMIPVWIPEVILGLTYLGVLAWGVFTIGSGMFLRAVCRGPGNKREVALTFDDGPDPLKSGPIMDMLDAFGCKASYFLIGKKLNENEGLVRRMAGEGHTLGTHSFSHVSYFPIRRAHVIRREILDTNRLLREITGIKVRYFRPPFGVTNPRIVRGLKGTGMEVAGWSVRSLDTRGENPQRVVQRIMKKTGPGDIILLHETSPHILEILSLLLPAIIDRGWISVGLDELFDPLR